MKMMGKFLIVDFSLGSSTLFDEGFDEEKSRELGRNENDMYTWWSQPSVGQSREGAC